LPLDHIHEAKLEETDCTGKRAANESDEKGCLDDGQSSEAKPAAVREQLVHQGPFLEEKKAQRQLGQVGHQKLNCYKITGNIFASHELPSLVGPTKARSGFVHVIYRPRGHPLAAT